MKHEAIVGLDDVVHQRTRLGIMATLVDVRRIENTALRDELGLTTGNLSRHLSILSDAGYVDIQRGYDANRPRMWIAVTRQGSAAYAAELKVLRELFAEDAALADGARARRPASKRSGRRPPLQPRVAGS